jgi:hypothetical protein
VNNSPMQHIVVRLACEGDATAFLTLFGCDIERVYAALCEQDGDEERAREHCVAFVRNVYRAFTTAKPRVAPRVWFERQRERLVPGLPVLTAASDTRVPGCENVRDLLETHLQRERRALWGRRSISRKAGKGPRGVQVAVATGVAVLAVVAAVIAAMQMVWLRSGTTVTLRYRSVRADRTVVFPFGATAQQSQSSGAEPGSSGADLVADGSPADGGEVRTAQSSSWESEVGTGE